MEAPKRIAFSAKPLTATFSAAVTGPILCGLVIGLFNEDYNYMFLFCAVMFALGLIVVSRVRHGETQITEEELAQIRMENED